MSTGPRRRFSGAGSSKFGAIAQLGERLNGIQEVTGSIPVSSTPTPARRRAHVGAAAEN
jgi:hypothetical protein